MVVDKMDCKTCAYGKEDFERRISWYDYYAKKYGIPNEVYGNMTREDAENEALKFIWCEKMGGKIYTFGKCSLAAKDTVIEDKEGKNTMPNLTATDYQKKSMRKRRKANAIYKLRIKRCSEVGGYYLPCNKRREYDTETTVYYEKYSSRDKETLKKVTNSRVRNHEYGFKKGSAYKKVHDRWNYD